MAAGSVRQPGKVIPFGRRVTATPSQPSAQPASVSLFVIGASRQVAELRRLGATGDHARYMKALANLRGWQFDTTLDPAAREKAKQLVWQFEINGWDEA